MADQRSRLKADIHHIMQQARRREHKPGTVTVNGNATVIVCDNSTIHVESPPAERRRDPARRG